MEIVLDAYPDKRYRGVVDDEPEAQSREGDAAREGEVRRPRRAALPEMAARVSFLTKALDAAALKVPPKKVVPPPRRSSSAAARSMVFVVDGGQACGMVPVTLGPAVRAAASKLLDGPHARHAHGERPAAALADGQSIKERTEP